MKKKLSQAQAALTGRAIILQSIGVIDEFHSSIWSAIGHLSFECADIRIRIDNANPYTESVISDAIDAMDAMIARAEQEASETLDIIKAWRK